MYIGVFLVSRSQPLLEVSNQSPVLARLASCGAKHSCMNVLDPSNSRVARKLGCLRVLALASWLLRLLGARESYPLLRLCFDTALRQAGHCRPNPLHMVGLCPQVASYALLLRRSPARLAFHSHPLGLTGCGLMDCASHYSPRTHPYTTPCSCTASNTCMQCCLRLCLLWVTSRVVLCLIAPPERPKPDYLESGGHQARRHCTGCYGHAQPRLTFGTLTRAIWHPNAVLGRFWWLRMVELQRVNSVCNIRK